MSALAGEGPSRDLHRDCEIFVWSSTVVPPWWCRRWGPCAPSSRAWPRPSARPPAATPGSPAAAQSQPQPGPGESLYPQLLCTQSIMLTLMGALGPPTILYSSSLSETNMNITIYIRQYDILSRFYKIITAAVKWTTKAPVSTLHISAVTGLISLVATSELSCECEAILWPVSQGTNIAVPTYHACFV